MSGPITCVVADDHPAMLAAVVDVLEHHGVEVVGSAVDGQQALALIEATKPRVALVDVRMPRLGGIEVAAQAAVLSPDTAIVFYTAFGDRALLSEALDESAAAAWPLAILAPMLPASSSTTNSSPTPLHPSARRRSAAAIWAATIPFASHAPRP